MIIQFYSPFTRLRRAGVLYKTPDTDCLPREMMPSLYLPRGFFNICPEPVEGLVPVLWLVLRSFTEEEVLCEAGPNLLRFNELRPLVRRSPRRRRIHPPPRVSSIQQTFYPQKAK